MTEKRWRQRSRSRLRRAVMAPLVVAVLAAAGCAPAAAVEWRPPAWELQGSVSPAVIAADELQNLGFVDGRIRNDTAALQMRYVEIQGADPFNARVRDLVNAAIAGTGTAFVPEVYGQDAGLGARGCIAGAFDAPAVGLLADPATGPVSGTGTIVVCEVLAAFDSTVAVGFRTISGAAAEGVDADIAADASLVLYADTASGSVIESGELWIPDAAAALGRAAGEILRREAGGLSAAPLAAPGADQLPLLGEALRSAVPAENGAMRFAIPVGFALPELQDLGVPPTAEPLAVLIDGETVQHWLSDAGAALLERRDQPFTGLPAWGGAHPVDCALVACAALTYDDGPGPFTEELLDTLDAYRAAATFYMLGNAATGAPETVQRAANAGHELGSHTMGHVDLAKASPEQARREVHGAAEVLTRISGAPVPTFRPPWGELSAASLEAIRMPAVLWSIDTNDWQGPGIDALVARAVDPATPGDIILFHDTHADTVNAAGPVIEGLRNRGFTLVTVSQLFDGRVPEGRVRGR